MTEPSFDEAYRREGEHQMAEADELFNANAESKEKTADEAGGSTTAASGSDRENPNA